MIKLVTLNRNKVQVVNPHVRYLHSRNYCDPNQRREMQTHEIRMHDAERRVAGMTQLAHTEKCSKYKTFVEYVVEGRR